MIAVNTPPTQLEDLMVLAEERAASDLHLMAGLPPTLRIDGRIVRLREAPLPPQDLEAMVRDLLDERQMEHLHRRRVAERAVDVPGLGRFRVSVFHAGGKLAASFRRVPGLQTAEELGLPYVVRHLASLRDGLVLVTGAVGTGTTTTLNHLVDRINSERHVRILTVEDPIEYVHENKLSVVLQMEVGSDTPSFTSALRACFRQDPNVICVGEMRDLKTVSMALRAAETGHLVLSTLHTPSAAATVNRIINVFPPHQQQQARVQVSNVLQGVVCQKLLPRAKGTGRVLAYEVIVATAAVRRLIRDGKEDQIPNLLDTGMEQGMVSMDHCLHNLCQSHAITFETARAHCNDPDRIRALEPVDPREG